MDLSTAQIDALTTTHTLLRNVELERENLKLEREKFKLEILRVIANVIAAAISFDLTPADVNIMSLKHIEDFAAAKIEISNVIHSALNVSHAANVEYAIADLHEVLLRYSATLNTLPAHYMYMINNYNMCIHMCDRLINIARYNNNV